MGFLHTSRHRLSKLPQDQAQLLQVGQVLVEGDLRGHALGLVVGVDRAVVLAPGAQRQPFADLAVASDQRGLLDLSQLADQCDGAPSETLPHGLIRQRESPHEVAEIVGERVELEPDGVVTELAARQA